MTLGASAQMQLLQATLCLVIGAACSALWLFLDKVPMVKFLRVVSDALLCLFVTAVTLVCVQTLNRGEILAFHPIAVLVGFFLCRKILPRFVKKLVPDLEPKVFHSKGKAKKFVLNTAAKAKKLLNFAFGKIGDIFKTAVKKTNAKLSPLTAKIKTALKNALKKLDFFPKTASKSKTKTKDKNIRQLVEYN